MFDDDFALFFEDGYDINKDSTTLDQTWCNHDFYPIELISSIVFNCKKCGIHKEDYDKQNHSPRYGGL